MTENDGLELTAFVKRGAMMINRVCLSVDDPESWPMKWVEKFGTIKGFDWVGCFGKEDAEDAKEAFYRIRYGIDSPAEIRRYGRCPHCGKYL